jgi:hypothetical protein
MEKKSLADIIIKNSGFTEKGASDLKDNTSPDASSDSVNPSAEIARDVLDAIKADDASMLVESLKALVESLESEN